MIVEMLDPLSTVRLGREGAPPDAVLTRSTGPTARSRPVFPYPALAKYSGQGDPNDAPSYGRGAPRFTGTAPEWAGGDFFLPWKH
jgi:hypothetical protein